MNRNAYDGKPPKRIDDAYILACNPLGILGLHHYYLERYYWAVAFTLTLGFLGIGWITDIIRMKRLVRSVNHRGAGGDPCDPRGYCHSLCSDNLGACCKEF